MKWKQPKGDPIESVEHFTSEAHFANFASNPRAFRTVWHVPLEGTVGKGYPIFDLLHAQAALKEGGHLLVIDLGVMLSDPVESD